MCRMQVFKWSIVFINAFLCGCTHADRSEENMEIKNTKTEVNKLTDTKPICGSAKYQYMIGQNYQGIKSELPKHRWKRPEYKYTQNYVAKRLNIITNNDENVISIKCG